MSGARRIAVVAPSCPLTPEVPDRITALAARLFGSDAPEIVFHPQCFLRCGHFAGSDAERLDALVGVANDPGFDTVWFARGGYGAVRIAAAARARLSRSHRVQRWVGYSDAGVMLAIAHGQAHIEPVHAPMPSDIRREGGEAAVSRVLRWLVAGDPEGLEPGLGDRPAAAFNAAVLAGIIGTPLAPDLAGHELLIEEIGEYDYRFDRAMAQITVWAAASGVAGLRLGRVSEVIENDRPFGEDSEAIARGWCARSGLAYLGRADIGHDASNRIVPFGFSGLVPQLPAASEQ